MHLIVLQASPGPSTKMIVLIFMAVLLLAIILSVRFRYRIKHRKKAHRDATPLVSSKPQHFQQAPYQPMPVVEQEIPLGGGSHARVEQSPSSPEEHINAWKSFIAGGLTKKAISAIMAYTKVQNLKDEHRVMINISSRWSIIQMNRTKGIIQDADLQLEQNKINNAVLDVIEKLEEELS